MRVGLTVRGSLEIFFDEMLTFPDIFAELI
jgi:hypothetical protein